MITVVTPFKRIENLPFLIKALQGKCHWVVLQADDEPEIVFPEWVTVKRYEVANKKHISNRLFNQFIANDVKPDMQYMLLNDDDSVEEGFFDKIPNAPVVCVSMKRGDKSGKIMVWDNWEKKIGHLEDGPDILLATPENMKIARVGGEQLVLKGDILKNYRYGLTGSTSELPGDARFVMQILHEYDPVFVPDAYVLFNYFEDGRFNSFRRKPVVLFIGDAFCAGNPHMGKSEWESNIWASLESTGLAEVAHFHMDKYYYHTGKRGDEALIERTQEIKPDLIVLVLYKPLGSDPTVITQVTLEQLNSIPAPIVAIWGDLEAEEQVALARSIEPYITMNYGTASEAVVSSLGPQYKYMHVPKDPRVFTNPNKPRDIDVLFNGSFGYGREERREVLQYLLDNGIKLVAGGSEGGDHFTTEEYADKYKRAKIAISFSRARGKDVVNARPFEAMLCGACVFAQESNEMEKLWSEQEDEYVSWENKEDLLQKITLVLNHLHKDVMWSFIAANGQKKTEQLYSAKTFWEEVMKNI